MRCSWNKKKRLSQPLYRSHLVVVHHVPQSVFHRRSTTAQHEGACRLWQISSIKSVRPNFLGRQGRGDLEAHFKARLNRVKPIQTRSEPVTTFDIAG